MSFDNEEKRISDALNSLDSGLKTPDLMLGIQKKLDEGMPDNVKTEPKRIRKPLRFLSLIAAVVAVLGITAAAISLGGFDWLMAKAKPPFGDVVKAIEQSAESQGIKITAVAAQNYSDMAVVYVTLEDTEGLGRVTEDTQLSFAYTSELSISWEMIYFDKDTSIAAYQIRMGAPNSFDGKSLSMQMDGLRYGKTDLNEIPMGIDLAQAVSKGEHVGNPYSDSTQPPRERLTPSHMADIPGTKSAWLSAIGVNGGYLAVQFGQPAGTDPTMSLRTMNQYNIHPYLLDANGNRVEAKNFSAGFETDAQLRKCELGQEGEYDLMEYYFTVDTNALKGYTLCFEGSAWNMVTGDWNLNVNFDSIPELREITADITVGEVQMTDAVLTISPFGLTLTGNGASDIDIGAPMRVLTVIETTKGDIELSCSGSSRPNPNGPYEVIWHASSAVDMDSVIAVRIGDNRILLR